MKKILLMTVIVIMLTASAFAESSISIGGYKIARIEQGDVDFSIFGRLSPGFRYSHRHVDVQDSSRFAIDSGTVGGDRFGFRGSFGLNEDSKSRVGFVLERGLNLDTGTEPGGWNRQANVYVSHADYGRLSVGRIQTPQFNFIGDFDPFDDLYDSLAANVYVYNPRWSNAATYDSPTWGGFAFTVGGSANTTGDEGNDNSSYSGNVTGLVFAPNYHKGGFSAVLNLGHYRLKSSDNDALLDKEGVMVTDLLVGYDFGPISVAGMFGVRNASERDFLLGSSVDTESLVTKTTQWMVGAAVPMFEKKGKIMVSFTGREMELFEVDSKAQSRQFSLGYTHAVNRYFKLYGVYGYINNDDTAKNSFATATVPGGSGYQSVTTLGAWFSF